jgi:hypothetical protein
VAVFCALEIKAQRGRPTGEQEQFLAVVQELGGLAGVVRSVPEARSVLQLAG